jgi:putative MATE family efflux protein
MSELGAEPVPGQALNENSIWSDIKESIRGSERDFTEGSIGKAILLLSIPMVLEMVMESIFAVVDIFFVAKLGPDAIATVGITESMLTIVYAIAIGLSMATTAMVARRTGEKDKEGAATAGAQALIVAVLVSLPITLIGIFFSKDLLRLMGASGSIVDTGFWYTTIMLSSNCIVVLLFMINAIFRGAGDAAIAMRALQIGNGINIILDPCLILGLGPFPELGVTGAAIATVIGRGSGVLYQIYRLTREGGRITILMRHMKVKVKIVKRLLKLSAGSIGQWIIATSSWIGMVRIMSSFGSEAVAGYTVAVRIIIFSILPSWGMSNAAATLVGQNLGAKKPERAEKSVWMAAFVNMIFLMMIAIVFIGFAEYLILFFTDEAAVVAIGAKCLRFISYGYVFYAYGMVMVQAFNGAGDTTTPTIMNFFLFWLLEIPLALFLSFKLDMRETGVFLSIITAESLLGVVGMILFKRGRWKTREV